MMIREAYAGDWLRRTRAEMRASTTSLENTGVSSTSTEESQPISTRFAVTDDQSLGRSLLALTPPQSLLPPTFIPAAIDTTAAAYSS